jgi:hypothetical protein
MATGSPSIACQVQRARARWTGSVPWTARSPTAAATCGSLPRAISSRWAVSRVATTGDFSPAIRPGTVAKSTATALDFAPLGATR